MVVSGVTYTGSMHNATNVAIGKATNVAIDHALLLRIKAVMPSYQSQKAYVNQLIDKALQQIESEAPQTPNTLPQ